MSERAGEEPRYTSAYAVAAEGHRIGLVTCLMCGATLTLDPVMNVLEKHDAWHRIIEDISIECAALRGAVDGEV